MREPEEEIDPLLANARRAFTFFYDIASEEDIFAMDQLVLTSEILAINIKFPRQPLPPPLRTSIERLGHLVELNFLDARRRLSECQTFQNLDCRHQQQIADALFSPFSDERGV